MPAGKEAQPECISQRASSGRLNCSCSRSRDLTAINPVVPEVMKIAALAVSTAHNGNMSFAFSKSVPIATAKGRGKRLPAWTNRRAKALVPCGFADAKTAEGILQYQNRRKRLSNIPRRPREEVRKYGSFQSGAKYGIYCYEQPPLAQQGTHLKGKGLVVARRRFARGGVRLKSCPAPRPRNRTRTQIRKPFCRRLPRGRPLTIRQRRSPSVTRSPRKHIPKIRFCPLWRTRARKKRRRTQSAKG